MASSLRTGLDGLRGWPGRVDAALITAGRHAGHDAGGPGEGAPTRGRPDALAVATYDGVRGHPVLLGRDHWAGVIETADRRRGRPPLPRRARRHRGRLHRPGRSDRPRRPPVRSTFGAVIARVVDEPLSVAEHEDAVADKAAGAVVSFAGVVRDHDGGRSVTELEYVGHPTAADVITELAARVRRPARRARRRGLAPDRPAGHRRRRPGLRGQRVAPRSGVRHLRRPRRRGEEAAADLEAAGLHRRRGGMGRLPVRPRPGPRAAGGAAPPRRSSWRRRRAPRRRRSAPAPGPSISVSPSGMVATRRSAWSTSGWASTASTRRVRVPSARWPDSTCMSECTTPASRRSVDLRRRQVWPAILDQDRREFGGARHGFSLRQSVDRHAAARRPFS